MYEEQRKELAQICHLLYERNLVAATDGNVSMRVSGEHILLTPSGKNKGFVKPEEMLVLNFDGTVVEGNGKASKEYPVHRAVYEAREDVKAVIHTHPVFATAFAMAGKNIPDNCLIETSMMLKGVALAGYAAPGSQELAKETAKVLETCDSALLKNHGVIVVGQQPESVFGLIEEIEENAHIALLLGDSGNPMTESQIREIRDWGGANGK